MLNTCVYANIDNLHNLDLQLDKSRIIKQIKANYTKKRNRAFFFYILLIMLESAIVDILQKRKEKKKEIWGFKMFV